MSRRRPLIVASKPVRSIEDLKVAEYIAGVDLIELRLDYAENLEAIPPDSLARFKGRVIATIRDPSEGGVRSHDREVKSRYLMRLHDLGLLYDVEASFLKSSSVPYEEKIVSVHFLDSLPSERVVLNLVERYADRAFCVKIAVSARRGYKKLLSAILDLGYDNVAVMPIGSTPAERLAFALLGSMLVYSYVDEPTAPGQMRYDEVANVLRILGVR